VKAPKAGEGKPTQDWLQPADGTAGPQTCLPTNLFQSSSYRGERRGDSPLHKRCDWVPLGWCLLVVTLSPFVVVVGYETAGYRHVADVEREAAST